MKRRDFLTGTAAAAAALGGGIAGAPGRAMAQAAGQTFNLTAAGLGPTGVMATINAGVAAAVQAAHPGSTITYQPGQGGFANILMVEQGKVPLGYAVDAEIALGLAGEPPFRDKVKGLKSIANVSGEVPMHVAFAKDVAERYGLKDFADIARAKPPLRIIFNTRGNVVSIIGEAMLAEIGVKPADIKAWGGDILYIPGQEMPNVFADRRGDGIVNMVNIRGASIVSMENARPMVMLPVDRGLIDRVAKKFGIATMDVPKSAYPWLDRDHYTLTLSIALVAREDLKDEHAYALAKALVEKNEALRAVHPSMKTVTPDFLTSLKVGEYHKGAARYYREAGLMAAT